jgi:hypothetical protein
MNVMNVVMQESSLTLTLPNDASEELITVSLWVKKENPVLKVKQVVKEKQLKPLAELFEVITH